MWSVYQLTRPQVPGGVMQCCLRPSDRSLEIEQAALLAGNGADNGVVKVPVRGQRTTAFLEFGSGAKI